MRFRADSTGKAAIFKPGTGGSNDVFDNPNIAPDRVYFHTEWPTLGVVKTLSGIVTHRSTSTNGYTRLGAHGQRGIPAYLGVLEDRPSRGKRTAWVGTVPVWQAARYPSTSSNWSQWLTLAIDGTNVYAKRSNLDTSLPFTARYTIYIFDRVMGAT